MPSAVAIISLCLATTSAWAGGQHLPADVYPPGTHVTQISPLTNQEMDCDWGFDCHAGQPVTNAPVFHLHTQDDLHRESGWAQFGDSPRHGRRVLFAVFASRYASTADRGLPWNVRAFSDFRGTLLNGSFDDVPLARVPRLIPRGTVGNVSEQLARSSKGDVVAMACWIGSVEIEGIAVFNHGSPSEQRFSVRYLTRQIQAAVEAIE